MKSSTLDKIYSQLFLNDKEKYKKELSETFIVMLLRLPSIKTKVDMLPWMHARLKGMATISKRKYGIYNKSIDGKSLFKVFPWLNCYTKN